MADPPPYIWHHAVHREWADEKLVFLFFAFEPTYNRDAAAANLEEFLLQKGICSYQIYEVTSPFDILVRAWVPMRLSPHELKAELDRDSRDGRRVSHVLEVAEIIHHWAWATKATAKIGDITHVSEADQREGRPASERDVINAIQGRTAAANGKVTLSKVEQTLVKDFRGGRFVTKPRYRTSGIRFLVLVKVKDTDNELEMKAVLRDLLNKASRTIRDPSLYRLHDHHQFLIFGNVREIVGEFHAISEKIVAPINKHFAAGKARTYTSFFPMRGFLGFRDELRGPELAPPREDLDIAELLEHPEGQRLEVKGSAFTELHLWLRGEGPLARSKRPVVDGKNAAVNALMRAIASLLNSDGGTIVVGAVEKSKYSNYDKFKELPAANAKDLYHVTGIEPDQPDGDFDSFALKLRDVIDRRFSPRPSVRWLRILPAHVAGRVVCVIQVDLPDEFYWVQVGGKGSGAALQPKYFVRTEGKTEELSGRQVPEHQRVTQRAPRRLG